MYINSCLINDHRSNARLFPFVSFCVCIILLSFSDRKSLSSALEYQEEEKYFMTEYKILEECSRRIVFSDPLFFSHVCP